MTFGYGARYHHLPGGRKYELLIPLPPEIRSYAERAPLPRAAADADSSPGSRVTEESAEGARN